jgi:hypothetical protein
VRILLDPPAVGDAEAGPACRTGRSQRRARTAARSRPAGKTRAERWGVFVVCESDRQQRELLERLSAEGYECRGLMV